MLLVHQRPKIDDKEVVGVGSSHRRDPDINIYLDTPPITAMRESAPQPAR